MRFMSRRSITRPHKASSAPDFASHHGRGAAFTSKAAARMELRWLPSLLLSACAPRSMQLSSIQKARSLPNPPLPPCPHIPYSHPSCQRAFALHSTSSISAPRTTSSHPVLNLALPRFLRPRNEISHCSFAMHCGRRASVHFRGIGCVGPLVKVNLSSPGLLLIPSSPITLPTTTGVPPPY